VDHWSTHLKVPWEAFRAKKKRLPSLKGKYSHIILTGSEASILEREQWVQDEMELILEAAEKGIPLLGSCYGHQLLALALAGPAHVGRCRVPEIGWIPIRILESSSLLGKPRKAHSFSIHFDEVLGLGPSYRILASTEICPIQAFEMRRSAVWGLQIHPEIGVRSARSLLKNLLGKFPDAGSLYRPALESEPKDSKLIRRIVANFLSSGQGKPLDFS
jgi:GMP synthase-like glutamine amidotransferase